MLSPARYQKLLEKGSVNRHLSLQYQKTNKVLKPHFFDLFVDEQCSAYSRRAAATFTCLRTSDPGNKIVFIAAGEEDRVNDISATQVRRAIFDGELENVLPLVINANSLVRVFYLPVKYGVTNWIQFEMCTERIEVDPLPEMEAVTAAENDREEESAWVADPTNFSLSYWLHVLENEVDKAGTTMEEEL